MDIDLTKRGLLMLFFRRRKLFISIFASIVAITVLYLCVATPLYSASGSLLVKFGANAVPQVSRLSDDSGRASGPEEDHGSALESNIELLKSRSLMRDVINEYGVEKLYPGITEDSEGSESPVEAAISKASKNLTVKIEQQSDILTLTYMNRDPQVATDFLQRLMVTFISHHSDYYKKPPTEFLAVQIKEASDKLAASQKNLEEFKAKNGLSSLENELQELIREKTEIQTAALKGIDDARLKLEELKLKESDMLNTYRPGSKVVVDLQHNIRVAEEQLRERQDDLKASANAQSRTAEDAENEDSTPKASRAPDQDVTGQMAAINKRLASIETQRSAYDDLFRQVQMDEENYKSYVEHGEQARINASLNKDMMTSISIVDEPVAPQKPSYPKKLLFLLVGLMAGMIFAGWGVIVIEFFDDRFTTPEQVAAQLGIPVLASFVAPTPHLIRKA